MNTITARKTNPDSNTHRANHSTSSALFAQWYLFSTTSQNGGEALHCTTVIDLGKQNHGKSKSRTAKASQGTAGHDAHTLYYSGTCPAPAHRKTIWHFHKLDALPSFLPVAIHSSCRSFCLAFDLATAPGGPLNRNNIKIFRTYSNSPAFCPSPFTRHAAPSAWPSTWPRHPVGLSTETT